jgi:hypothetical protein
VAGAELKHATHLSQKVMATASPNYGEPYFDNESNASHNTCGEPNISRGEL